MIGGRFGFEAGQPAAVLAGALVRVYSAQVILAIAGKPGIGPSRQLRRCETADLLSH